MKVYEEDYLFEKFFQATHELVRGQGDARSRVKEAYEKFYHINIDDYPNELKEKRKKIQYLLTRLPAREGHKISENIAKMKNVTASKIADLIFEIYNNLCKRKYQKKDK